MSFQVGNLFVGKAIRQWAHPTPMWAVRVDGWTLTILPSEGEVLPFTYLLARRGTHHSGIAASLHEAEAMATCTAKTTPSKGRCFVCGSSASNRKVLYEPVRSVMLCDAHQSVCRRHQSDPCVECDQ